MIPTECIRSEPLDCVGLPGYRVRELLGDDETTFRKAMDSANGDDELVQSVPIQNCLCYLCICGEDNSRLLASVDEAGQLPRRIRVHVANRAIAISGLTEEAKEETEKN